MDDILLRTGAVADIGDVAHVDGRAVHHLDRQVVECGDRFRRIVQADAILGRADLDEAGRIDLVLRGNGVADILRRQPLGLERQRIEVDLHLTLLAARGEGHGETGDGHQLRPDLVLAKVEQLLFRQALARQRELQDRHRRRAIVQDQRRGDARRHLAQHGLRDRRHLRGGGADVGAGLEIDLDDANALQRLAFDMFDVVDRGGQHALIGADDAARHVLGRQAGILEGDRDHRDADIGEHVDRGARGGQDAHDRDQDRHDNEGQRAMQGNLDDTDHSRLPAHLPAERCRGAKIWRLSRRNALILRVLQPGCQSGMAA